MSRRLDESSPGDHRDDIGELGEFGQREVENLHEFYNGLAEAGQDTELHPRTMHACVTEDHVHYRSTVL